MKNGEMMEGAHDVHTGKITVQHQPEENPQRRAEGEGDDRDESGVENHLVEVPRAEDVRVVVQADEGDADVGPYHDPADEGQPEGGKDGSLRDHGDDDDGGQGQEGGSPALVAVVGEAHCSPLPGFAPRRSRQIAAFPGHLHGRRLGIGEGLIERFLPGDIGCQLL